MERIKMDLKTRAFYCIMSDRRLQEPHNIKDVEWFLQEDIEKVLDNNECWWKHTDRKIFEDLLELATSKSNRGLDDYICRDLIPSLYE